MTDFHGLFAIVYSDKQQEFNSIIEKEKERFIKILKFDHYYNDSKYLFTNDNFNTPEELFDITFLDRKNYYEQPDAPYDHIEQSDIDVYYLFMFLKNTAGCWEFIHITPLKANYHNHIKFYNRDSFSLPS